ASAGSGSRDDLMLVGDAHHAEAVLKFQSGVEEESVAARGLQPCVDNDSGAAENLIHGLGVRTQQGDVISDKSVDVDTVTAQHAGTGLYPGNRDFGDEASRR